MCIFVFVCACVSVTEQRLALVVLHPPFDPDFTIPDINRHVTRNDVLTVNFLFHATQGGLLTCPQNDKSLKMISSELGYEVSNPSFVSLFTVIIRYDNYHRLCVCY